MQTLKGHKGKVRALAFAPNSNHLVSVAGHGSSISLWNLARGSRTYLSGLDGKPEQLIFSRSGDRLIARDDHTRLHIRDIRTEGWPVTYDETGVVQAALTGPQEALAQVVVPRAGRCELRISGTKPVPLPWHRTAIAGLASAPDGTVLAITLHTDDRRPPVSVVFVRLGASVELSEPLPLNAIPYSAAFSPDGATLVVATTKSIQRFATATGTPLSALKEHRRMISGMAYLPDGRLLSCSADGTVRTWDGERCVDVKDWQLGMLSAITVAPDGLRAAIGCNNGNLLLWDMD
jgi:WD40 repeat protein